MEQPRNYLPSRQNDARDNSDRKQLVGKCHVREMAAAGNSVTLYLRPKRTKRPFAARYQLGGLNLESYQNIGNNF